MELRVLEDAVREEMDPFVRLRQVVDEALVLVPHADGAAVLLLGDDGWLTCTCTGGSLAGHAGFRLHAETSLSGQAMRSFTVLRSMDIETDARVDREAARSLGIRSMVCVPLHRAAQVFGMLVVSAGQPAMLTEADLEVLTRVADFLSVVVGAVAELGQVTSALLPPRALGRPADPAAVADRSHVTAFVANVLTPHLVDRVATALRARRMVETGDFAIVFQPIVDLVTGEVAGYEALTRFSDGRPPDVWFAEAHRAGLGLELELLAVSRALTTAPANLQGFLALNVSPLTLLSPDLERRLNASPRSSHLVLELTEHESIGDYRELRTRMAGLRDHGVQVAVDDVGSGFASLRHVVDLCPDIIKIDRSLISYIDRDRARHGLAVAFAQLAFNLDWTVIAEGIERDEERAVCSEIGIRYGQGYLLGRPAPLLDQRGPKPPWLTWSEEIWEAAHTA
jgi:EAL domain-containing protein (putative c-di-GMP-specific phosphodiesterase class I)